MIEKYGETALSDIKHYHSVKSGIAFVGIEMALIGTLVLGVKGDFS